MFIGVTGNGPAYISVFTFGPHIVKEVEGNCTHFSSYPPASTCKVAGSIGMHTASLIYPQKKIFRASKVRRTRWPSDRPALSIIFYHFLCNSGI
jgi:hypothetical protein